MLGITTPDAVAIGTLIIGLLAAWRGSREGTAAKSAAPPLRPDMAMIGGALVDRQTLQELVNAVNGLTAFLKHQLEMRQKEHADKIEDTLESLLQKISAIEKGRG